MVGPWARTCGHLGQLHELFQDRRRVLGAEENVQIADRLGPPPQAAADLGPDDLGMLADGLEDRRDQPQRFALQDPLARLFQERDALEDVGLGLGPEALLTGDLARLGRRSQVGQALDLQASRAAP